MAKLSAKYEVMAVYSMKDGEDAAKALVEKFKITEGVMRSMIIVK